MSLTYFSSGSVAAQTAQRRYFGQFVSQLQVVPAGIEFQSNNDTLALNDYGGKSYGIIFPFVGF